MGVGTLVAPMNGSVASTSALLSRLVAPRLGRLEGGVATALVSVAATIGVVVPPSLVLILLGDALQRAHTEASNLPGQALGAHRIINTQDVFHAALLPAAGVLLLWLGVAWWQGRRLTAAPMAPATPRQWLVAGASVAAVVVLLTGVFRGTVFAVEGAATAGVALMVATLATRALNRQHWQTVLVDTLTLSGALLALLVGAATFSLVFRLWGTDRWLSAFVLGSPLPGSITAALVLALVALCAWVLDAFEMIFVIIPIVAPPLIVLLGDAQQAAVLLLLVLQLSFLIPPMGYAVMMARTRAGLVHVPLRHTLWALLPYLAVQGAVTVAVFSMPALVHALDDPAPALQDTAPANADDVEQLMRDMASQGQAAPPPPEPTPANTPRP